MSVLGRNRILFQWRAVLAALICFVALSVPAWAEEAITSFNADVLLHKDGSVAVTETINVRSEARDIQRGIFRDIPTVLVNDNGTKVRSSLDVISVERDGHSEPFSTEGIENGTRIYIGDKDVFLQRGDYSYTINYTMTRMGRQFPNHDELYWNATGNFWAFPIEKATATITLPDGAVIEDLAGFTGAFGAGEQAVKITRTSDNAATFRATRSLAPYEGMSVAAKFQKGILADPGMMQKALYVLSDYRSIILPILAVFVVLLYNFFAWDSVGKDPKRGTIIPRFHPPKGYSPALVNYVHRWGFNKNGWLAFTSAIINLGVKGLITIHEIDKKTQLSITDKTPESPLSSGEAVVWRFLQSKRQVLINTSNGLAINKTKKEFLAAIESESREVYFRNNILYIVGGVILSVLSIVVLVLTDVLDPIWLFLSIFGGVFLGLGAGFFGSFWKGGGFARFVTIFWVVLFASNVIGGVGPMFDGDFHFDISVWSAMSIIIINVVFAVLMRAPTVQGRKLMDEIDGLKMYLETAEKERLNFQSEPDMSVTRFEALLPYAIALGVEKPWSKRFESDLARNAVSDVTGTYVPLWYYGTSFTPTTIGKNMSSLASGMSASMIAAQPVSSSSSGFSSGGGGGGFSGGGGGGGGGGGW